MGSGTARVNEHRYTPSKGSVMFIGMSIAEMRE
jgi:hypothetical protein